MNDMVLIKVHNSHWILGNIDIQCVDYFGFSGWHIPSLNKDRMFPETYDTLEEALSVIIGKPSKVKPLMPRPAGM